MRAVEFDIADFHSMLKVAGLVAGRKIEGTSYDRRVVSASMAFLG